MYRVRTLEPDDEQNALEEEEEEEEKILMTLSTKSNDVIHIFKSFDSKSKLHVIGMNTGQIWPGLSKKHMR